jgi:repressor LexA
MDHPAITSAAAGARITVPRDLLDQAVAVDDHYVLRVVGDSVLPEHILDGDYAVIARRDPRPGEVVVALVGDEASIKRWYPEGGTVRLAPLDPNLQPISVPTGEVHIRGVVVGLMRRF